MVWWKGAKALIERLLLIPIFFATVAASTLVREDAAVQPDPEPEELCQIILQEMAAWDHVEVAYLMAQANDPRDPIRRSIGLREHLPTPLRDAAVPFEIWKPRSVNRSWPRFRRQNIETSAWVVPKTKSGWPSLRAIPDFELNTIRYVGVKDYRSNRGNTFTVPFPEAGRDYTFKEFLFEPNQHSRLVVDWAAGLTGLASHSGRVFNQIRLMNTDRTDGLTMELLRGGANPLFFQTSAVTADRPFHASGSSAMEYFTLEGSVEWRRAYYTSLRQNALQKLTAGTRSGESLLVGEANARNPGLFNGMIWMSPMHPTVGYNASLQGYREDAVAKGVALNPLAFRWFTNIRNEMVAAPGKRWWENADPTNGTPLLILVGEHDPEVSAETREEYRGWARRNPKTVFYVEVPGAGHDIFSVTEDTDGNKRRWSHDAELRAARSWAYVYWFMRSQVLKEPGVAMPNYGWLLQ